MHAALPIRRSLLVIACFLLVAASSEGSKIRNPVSVESNTGGNFSANFHINNTINQSGLFSGFISGASDFNDYLDDNPLHTRFGSETEWSAITNTASSTIVYNMGDAYLMDKIALWNEEAVGIGVFSLAMSDVSASGPFTHLGTFSPTDNVGGQHYGADVFNFAPTTAQFVRLIVTRPTGSAGAVSMGEVAFSTTAVPVPEPVAVMGGLALLATLVVRRSRF